MATGFRAEPSVDRGMGLTNSPRMNVSYCNATTRLGHITGEEKG